MAKETKIEWCDGTWNPWYGCDKISPACDNCYAERWAKRAGKDFSKITYASYQSLRNPIKWKTPKRIFVCSLGDFFHRGVRGAIREQAYFIMRKADWHTYLILTKRPEEIVDKYHHTIAEASEHFKSNFSLLKSDIALLDFKGELNDTVSE